MATIIKIVTDGDLVSFARKKIEAKNKALELIKIAEHVREREQRLHPQPESEEYRIVNEFTGVTVMPMPGPGGQLGLVTFPYYYLEFTITEDQHAVQSKIQF